MSTEIENKARKSLQAMSTSSTIQKHLSVNRTRTLLAIDRAISGLTEEFRKVSNNNNSNQRLYDAITRADAGFSKRLLNDADRVAALEDAKQQLESIVGTEAQSRLVAQLRTDANLSESQGSDTLGFVSSGIIDAIKSELPVGAATVGSAATVSGNASAITALLNKTTPGPQHSTPTSHSEALHGTAHGTVHSAGSRAVADSGNSELMRYAVPLLLLAALLLGTMKFCSEQGKSRVIAEERNVLQQELASVQEQADKDTAKMASLESEYSATLATAQAEKEQLQSDLQFVTTELAELRDVPTDTAELQQRLAKVTTERDEALENSLSVAEQIEAIKLERDKLNQQRELLTSDLATANSTISSLNRQKTVAINQIGSLAQLNEQAKDDLMQANSTISSLNRQKTVAINQIGSLAQLSEETKDNLEQANSTISSLNSQKTEAINQIGSLAQLSRQTKNDLMHANSTISSLNRQKTLAINQIGSLAQLSEQTADNLAQANSTISSLNRQKTVAINHIGSLAQLSEQAKDDLMQVNSTISSLNRQKTVAINKIGSLAKLSKQTKIDLMQANSTISSLNRQKTVAINQIGSLAQLSEQSKDDLMQANSTISSLNRQKTEGINQIGSLAQLSEQTKNDLMQANSTISSLNRQKTVAINQIGSLAQLSEQTKDDLTQANSTISSLNGQKTVAINQIGSLLAQRNELEENVATLTEEQLKEQQKWAKQYDTAVLNIVALEQSLSESSQEIAQLTAQRNKMQSVVDAESAKNEALTRDTLALRDTLKKKLSDAGVKSVFVKSIENDRAVAMTLGSSGLFRKGDVSLTREGGKVLGAIGKAVTDYPDWYIDVEGHTDSDPIGKKLSQRYPSNWELSSARASAVINFLRFTTDVNTENLSARGFAETRPVADNNSPSGRNQNRRVDIILRR